MKHTKKTAVVLTAVAAMSVVGGTLAVFTDSKTTEPQLLKAGTVKVDLVEDANWNTSLGNLAVGDTMERGVTIDNSSTLTVKSLTLTALLTDYTSTSANLSDAITVDIVQGANVLADDVRLSELASSYELVLPAGGLPAGTDVDLDFLYTFAGDAAGVDDNQFQGSELDISYNVTAVQRDGAPQ